VGDFQAHGCLATTHVRGPIKVTGTTSQSCMESVMHPAVRAGRAVTKVDHNLN
jgi:hypothetical protein